MRRIFAGVLLASGFRIPCVGHLSFSRAVFWAAGQDEPFECLGISVFHELVVARGDFEAGVAQLLLGKFRSQQVVLCLTVTRFLAAGGGKWLNQQQASPGLEACRMRSSIFWCSVISW